MSRLPRQTVTPSTAKKMPHHYTINEANSMLPEVTRLLQSMQGDGRQLEMLRTRVSEMKQNTRGNGYHSPGEEVTLAQAIKQVEESLQKSLQQFMDWEIQVKDLNIGLIDFPALLDGRTVFLCWQLGEPRVGYWHETSTGYASRQPLDDRFL